MILIFKEASVQVNEIWEKYPELQDMHRQPHQLVKIITIHNLYDAHGYSKFRFVLIGKIEGSIKDFLRVNINMDRAIFYEADDTNWR